MKTKAESTTHAQPKKDNTSLHKQEGDFFIPPSVQAKLTVNKPGDPFEQEADAVADQILLGSAEPLLEEDRRFRLQAENKEDEIQRVAKDTPSPNPEMDEEIQRKQDNNQEKAPDEEAIQRKEAPKEDEIQQQCTDCEKEQAPTTGIQRASHKTNTRPGQTAPSIVSEVTANGGSPLDSGTRKFMEGRFGADFSNVRIHDNEKAHESANIIAAQAYTYGSDIVFAKGKYEPQTQSGKHLLAHELTHVIQQGQVIRRRLESDAPASTLATTSTEAPPILEKNNSTPAAKTTPEAPEVTTPILEEQAAPPLPAVVVIEPIMPPPPEKLGEEAKERLQNSQHNARSSAKANATLPPSDELTQNARQGVTEPEIETTARAAGAIAATLSERLSPSPEILELCDNIRRVIKEKRPTDEDSLLKADPEEAAKEAGSQLNDSIDSDVERVEGEYNDLDQTPVGTPTQIGEEIVLPPEQVNTPDINASAATPDPLTAEEVSLDADMEASASQLEDAGMNTPVADVITDGPVAEGRAAHSELEQKAAEDPALVLAQQDESLANARQNMENLQEQALRALESSRANSVQSGGAQQLAMVGSEEQQRAAMSARAEGIFTTAQNAVNTQLEPLTATAMEMWNAGKDRISTAFKQHLSRVQSWVDDRHSGFGGGLVSLWDDLTGLPDWVTDEYDDAERNFGDDICDLIQEISLYVNGIIVISEELIDTANREIDELFANAPEELQTWATEQREGFQTRLDGLRDQVTNTQDNFNKDLANQAAAAVQEVREEVHALREAAKGLLGRIADAIQEFLDDPVKAIINGLLRLVGIEPATFWALAARISQVMDDMADDPLGFASNLLAAIGSGFQRFFDNFFGHLFDSFIQWIFSGLGAVGVEVPADFSLKSIITFFLQLMGISWERIKMLIARHIGEENVALLEQAYDIISDLIELGPQGVFELIKDMLNPQQILDTIINMAVEFVIEALITQATIRIIALFNPVGAIIQAIEAIYKILKWIFDNAARIFTLVESVVNGIADILAGNIAGMAVTVENALAQLLIPVIDFVAEFMSLGGLPEKVAEAVKGLQDWVEGILDKVIGWLTKQAKAILQSLGIKEDADPEEENTTEEELEDTEVGKSISFTVAGEKHRLWIDTEGPRPKVMMASVPKEVDEVIEEATADAKNSANADAPKKINEAKQTLTEVKQQATVTDDLIEEAKDGQPKEGEVEKAKQADDATEVKEGELVRDVKEMLEQPEVPPAKLSPFNNSKAQGFQAENVYKHPETGSNHPPGSGPDTSALDKAFTKILALGVGGHAWIRFHLFNKKLGGEGVNSNLIPMPGYINSEYSTNFENHLIKLYDANKPIWFLSTVTYRTDDSDFVQDFDATGGALKYENGKWVDDKAISIPDYSPGFIGLPDVGKVNINDYIYSSDEELKKIFSKLTPISEKMLIAFKEYKKGGQYTSKNELKAAIENKRKTSKSRKTTEKNFIDKLDMSF